MTTEEREAVLAVLITTVDPAGRMRHWVLDNGVDLNLQVTPGAGEHSPAILSLRAWGEGIRTFLDGPASAGQAPERVLLARRAGEAEHPVRLRRGDETAWGRLQWGRVNPAEWLAFPLGLGGGDLVLRLRIRGDAALALWAAVERRRDQHLWASPEAVRLADFQAEATRAASAALAAVMGGAPVAEGAEVWRGEVAGVALSATAGDGGFWLALAN